MKTTDRLRLVLQKRAGRDQLLNGRQSRNYDQVLANRVTGKVADACLTCIKIPTNSLSKAAHEIPAARCWIVDYDRFLAVQPNRGT